MWSFLAPLGVPIAKLILLLIDKSSASENNKKKLSAYFQSAISIMERDRAAPAKLRKDVDEQVEDLNEKEANKGISSSSDGRPSAS